MDKEAENFTTFMDENDRQVLDVDFDGKETCDIKADSLLLAGFYIKFFDEFNKLTKGYNNKFITEMIEKNKLIFIELKRKSNPSVFKTRANAEVRKYVLDNYLTISEFFDFWMEVLG